MGAAAHALILIKKYFLFDAPGPMPASKPRRDNAEFRKYFCDFCAKTPVYTNHAIRYAQYERLSASYRQIKNRRTTGRIAHAAHPLRSPATAPCALFAKDIYAPCKRNRHDQSDGTGTGNGIGNGIGIGIGIRKYRFLHQTFPIDAFCTKFFVSTLSAQRIS